MRKCIIRSIWLQSSFRKFLFQYFLLHLQNPGSHNNWELFMLSYIQRKIKMLDLVEPHSHTPTIQAAHGKENKNIMRVACIIITDKKTFLFLWQDLFSLDWKVLYSILYTKFYFIQWIDWNYLLLPSECLKFLLSMIFLVLFILDKKEFL